MHADPPESSGRHFSEEERSSHHSLIVPVRPDKAREYEDLLGGEGSEIFYRPERYPVSELLEGNPELVHSVEFNGRTGALVNFGINGLAFSVDGDEVPKTNEVFETIKVVIGDDIVYEGGALVRYCRSEGLSTLIGVSLLDGILDLDSISISRGRALAQKTLARLQQLVHDPVAPTYKNALADLALLLSSYRTMLDEQEKILRSVTPSEKCDQAEQEVLRTAIRTFSDQYDGYRRRCNTLTASLRPTVADAYREYTEALLHPYFLGAPLAHHCYAKPLGYPGDYVLMGYVYDEEYRGNSLFDKLIHQVVVREEPMARGVRTRKDFVKSEIERTVQERGRPDRPLRILSLACGPAREIIEFVAAHKGRQKLEITLVDQDQKALTYVNAALSKQIIPGRASVSVRYLYIGFLRLLQQSSVLDSINDQDLIYTVGLFDYLKTRTGRVLALRLYQNLRPGGKLIIGNFKRPNDAIWSLEYWMDWKLIYRTTDEMLELCGLIEEEDPSHEREVVTDASGYTNLLIISKQGPMAGNEDDQGG